MAEPIRVSVFFDAQNTAALRRGGEELGALAKRVHQLAQSQAGLGAAARTVADDMNRYAQQVYRAWHPAVTGLNRVFEELYGTLGRLTRLGLYKVVADFAVVSYGLTKMFREFVRINEQFQGLEITLSSAFKSVLVARQIRQELVKITALSPVPFEDLGNTARSLAIIPQLSAQFARQSVRAPGTQGSLSDPNGFFRKAIQLVEQLLTFRPDKQAKDATFAIREAVTGELRSLIRRFDFPPSLLATASGRSLGELKRDPVGMVEAMKAALDKIISPAAVKQLAYQPQKLRENILEQGVSIPLLAIGDAGVFRTMTDTFGRFYDRLTAFTTNKFKQTFAPRFSEAMTQAFFSASGALQKGLEILLEQVGPGFSARSQPGKDVFERVTSASLFLVEKTASKIPGFIEQATEFATKVVPIFVRLVTLLGQTLASAMQLLVNHPFMALLGYSTLKAFPALLATGFSKALESAIKAAQNARFGGLNLAGAGGGVAGSAGTITGSVGSLSAIRQASGFVPVGNTASKLQRFLDAVLPSGPAGVSDTEAQRLSGLSSSLSNRGSYVSNFKLNDPRIARNLAILQQLGATDLGGGTFHVPANTVSMNPSARVSVFGTGLQNLGPAVNVLQGRGFQALTQAERLALNAQASASYSGAVAGYGMDLTAAERAAGRSGTYSGLRRQVVSGSSGLSGRIGGLAGMAAIGLGAGEGAAVGTASAVAGISAFVGPIIAAMVVAGAVTMLVSAVSEELDRRRTKDTEDRLARLGLLGDTNQTRIANRAQETQAFSNSLRSAVIEGNKTLQPLMETGFGEALDKRPGAFAGQRVGELNQQLRDVLRAQGGFAKPVLTPTGFQGTATSAGFGSGLGPTFTTITPTIERDKEGKLAKLVNEFKGTVVKDTKLTLQQFVDLDAAMSSDIVALNDILAGKFQGGKTYSLRSADNFTISSENIKQAEALVATITAAQSQNEQVSKIIREGAALTTGAQYETTLSPTQASAQANFKKLETIFRSNTEMYREYFVNILGNDIRSGDSTTGGTPITKLFTQIGAVETPQIPPGLIEKVDNQFKELTDTLSPNKVWGTVLDQELKRIEQVRDIRQQVLDLTADPSTATTLKTAQDALLKNLEQQKSSGQLPDVSDASFKDLVTRIRSSQGMKEFQDSTLTFISDYAVKGTQPLADAFSLLAKDSLLQIQRAVSGPERSEAIKDLQYAVDSSLKLIVEASSASKQQADESFKGLRDKASGLFTDLFSLDAIDQDLPNYEQLVKERSSEASLTFIDGWTKMFKDLIEGSFGPNSRLIESIDAQGTVAEAVRKSGSRSIEEARRQRARQETINQRSQFDNFFGGFEVQSGADSGRLSQMLADASSYSARYGVQIPESVKALTELSTAGQEGFTNQLHQFDALREALAEMSRQSRIAEIQLNEVGDTASLDRLKAQQAFTEKLLNTSTQLANTRYGRLESRRQRFLEGFNSVIDAKLPTVQTPEATALLRTQLGEFRSYAALQGLPDMAEFESKFAAPRDTVLQRIEYDQNRIDALRRLKSAAEAVSVESFAKLDFGAGADAAREAKIFLQQIVAIQEALAQIGGTDAERNAKAATDLLSGRVINSNSFDRTLNATKVSQTLSNLKSMGLTGNENLLNSAIGQNPQFTTDQLAQLKALKEINAQLAEQANSKYLENITTQNTAAAKTWLDHRDSFLEFSSTFQREIEKITGKNQSMVGSFKEGFLQVTDNWRATATNFSQIGGSLANGVVDNLTAGFTDFAMNAKTASEALQEFTHNMLRMAIQLLTQKSLQMVFGALFNNIGGTALTSTGLGTGGGGLTFNAGASGLPTMARGGYLGGPASDKDNMLIYASSGEYVIPSDIVSKYGVHTFEAYRQGRVPAVRHFASGGMISRQSFAEPSLVVLPTTASERPSSSDRPNVGVTVNVTVNEGGRVEKSDVQTVGKNAEDLGKAFKAIAEQVVAESWRQGGQSRNRR